MVRSIRTRGVSGRMQPVHGRWTRPLYGTPGNRRYRSRNWTRNAPARLSSITNGPLPLPCGLVLSVVRTIHTRAEMANRSCRAEGAERTREHPCRRKRGWCSVMDGDETFDLDWDGFRDAPIRIWLISIERWRETKGFDTLWDNFPVKAMLIVTEISEMVEAQISGRMTVLMSRRDWRMPLSVYSTLLRPRRLTLKRA